MLRFFFFIIVLNTAQRTPFSLFLPPIFPHYGNSSFVRVFSREGVNGTQYTWRVHGDRRLKFSSFTTAAAHR